MTTAFYPLSFSSPSAAWTAFAAGASVFGAPVPSALAALVTDGAAPVTEEEIDALLDAAYAMAEDDGATGIDFDLWDGAPGKRGVTVSFGTGRTRISMDIVTSDGQRYIRVSCGASVSSTDPADLISAADSLRRRWEAVMAHAEPVSPIDEADIVIYRRAQVEGDEEA